MKSPTDKGKRSNAPHTKSSEELEREPPVYHLEPPVYHLCPPIDEPWYLRTSPIPKNLTGFVHDTLLLNNRYKHKFIYLILDPTLTDQARFTDPSAIPMPQIRSLSIKASLKDVLSAIQNMARSHEQIPNNASLFGLKFIDAREETPVLEVHYRLNNTGTKKGTR